ncbi:hypothetical protein Fot_15549 [Forsythia ovata]|uniref:Phospholipid scramblase n=1 Tax=Forsythia ovata TaxID=205694 RepID=A0ABD1W9G7_9LAMI
MYVTRPLSHYLKDPESLAIPPEEPNSGYLIIQDEESETYSCFGLCKNRTLMNLPFPQNKELTVRYVTSSGEHTHVSLNPVYLIPVLNQPVSSNRYYAINRHGKHKGEAFTCSREEDMSTCCFCRCVKDLKPRQLDPSNIYQQIEICPYETLCTSRGYFFAKSVEPDGFPPYFFRRKGWSMYSNTPKHFKLDEALEVFVEGNKALWNENNVVDGVMWFKSFHNGAETRIGLRMEIVQRMIWEQKRVGWQGSGENQKAKINRVEEFRENWGWKEFGCYALVENFVLKRMDGSLVMTYSFLHTHQLKCKWE